MYRLHIRLLGEEEGQIVDLPRVTCEEAIKATVAAVFTAADLRDQLDTILIARGNANFICAFDGEKWSDV